MTKKQILLNAFNMNCVGHINHGLWTHPRDTSTAYKTLDYWTGLARLLERGLFDGLFLADIVGVYDVYQDSADLTLRESIQLPVNDPLLIVPAMAAATRHLGFGVTVNLTYEAPYLLARRFSTLDHLTQGRVGWNIVTGYLERGARHGLSGQIAHDERYDRADEFLDVAYQLWEGSWDADAVKADKRARVMPIPPPCAGWTMPANTIVFKAITWPSFAAAHAGAVPGGLVGAGLAARHAECVFVSSQTRRGCASWCPSCARRSRARAAIRATSSSSWASRPSSGERNGKPGQARRVPALRQSRGWPGALRQLHRHRFFHLRAGRADPLREEQRHRIRRAQPDRRAHRPHGA